MRLEGEIPQREGKILPPEALREGVKGENLRYVLSRMRSAGSFLRTISAEEGTSVGFCRSPYAEVRMSAYEEPSSSGFYPSFHPEDPLIVSGERRVGIRVG